MWFCKHRRAVITLFLKSVCYTYILISLQPTRSLICILNEDEICRVRRAVVGQFNIKRIMINCFKYIHASREIIAHLTRQTKSALPMFTINASLSDKHYIIDYKKCSFASFGRAVTTLFKKSVCYTYDFILP